MVAASYATDMCNKLIAQGFSELHFYTLNRAELVYAVCRMLGLRDLAAINVGTGAAA
jgi:methylenetetrahydrofolate reductase (NADPH)